MLTSLIWTAVAIAVLFALHHAALWAERRGWIFYKHRKASPGTTTRAVLEVQSLFEASKKHVVESRLESRAEEDASGEPPSSDRNGQS